jgi:1,5-anhydro-D-fructose reductase (1,5-anhydro-D-mannitol-forming)
MIRFGIAGFGLHAVKRLMPGFALARDCRVSALSRRDLAKAQESARQYSIPNAFASTADLCRSPEVDAVFVVTPNSVHLEDVITAVESGKPVLCEKPMGMNAAECRLMVEAARKAKVRLGIAQVFRFEESVAWLRDRVAAGWLGAPIFARVEFSFPGARHHARTWLNNPKIAGGGPVADIGVHCIDTLRYILQDEVIRVGGRAIPNKEVADIEAGAALTLEFSKGTIGTVLCSFLAEYRTPVELVGDAGVLRAEDCLNVERSVKLVLAQGGTTVETATVSNQLAYARQVDAFASAVEGKADFAAPGEEGWQNQEILDAAYRSMQSGKVQDVPRVQYETS